MNLIMYLHQIKDFRRGAGKRFPLTPILLIVIMSILTGNSGYREIARFSKSNKSIFIKFFKNRKHGLPSYVTYRNIIKGLDFNHIIGVFHQWSSQYISIEKGEWFSIDGKSLKSTVTDYSTSYQTFVAMISAFSHKQGAVLGMIKMDNKKESEIPKVQELIALLDLHDVVFTIDALHCQKKR